MTCFLLLTLYCCTAKQFISQAVLTKSCFFNIEVCGVLFQSYKKKKDWEAVDSSVVQLLLHVQATLHSAEEGKTILRFHQKNAVGW